jgi:hypothetical protein
MASVFALIEEEEDRHEFTLHEKEEDAERAGANLVVEHLKEGSYAGIDFKPILDLLADGKWREVIKAYNGLGFDQIYVTEEEIERVVKGPSAGDLGELQEVLIG